MDTVVCPSLKGSDYHLVPREAVWAPCKLSTADMIVVLGQELVLHIKQGVYRRSVCFSLGSTGTEPDIFHRIILNNIISHHIV